MLRQLALVILVPSVVAAQQPPAAPLKPANATVTAGFTNVLFMHELSDGRVLMSDAMAGLIGVGNFATGKFEPIPNVNAGPLVRLAGDSSLMWGIGEAQWVFFLGARPIGMLPADNPVVAAARSVYGADSMGHVLAHGTTQRGDSVAVVLVARTTAQQDTVTWLWLGPATSDPTAPRHVYQVFEQALLTIDGWIAVLRTTPYRIDWRTPDGHWILGAPIPIPAVKLDDREKRAYMVQRARGGAPEPPETITNWPATVEPWTYVRAAMTSSDGKLLVRRTPTADFPDMRYDVINRRGELERQITMVANQKILGFGAKSVYVTVTGKEGAQSVQRHPWP